MKKQLLTLMLLLVFTIITSCDIGTASPITPTYPEVSDQQAATAIFASAQAMVDTDITMAIVMNTLAGGGTTTDTEWTVAVTAAGDSTITFASYDITAISGNEYDSLSGTIFISGADITFNLTLTGGPVITFYYITTNNIPTEITVNGHDMSHLL